MLIVAFLNLIRWKNILLILYMQCIIKFIFFKAYPITETLSNFHFILYVGAVCLITAGGYVINDIFDIEKYFINKPKKVVISNGISLKNSKNSYWILTILGVLFGMLLSFQIEKPFHSFIFIFISILLYLYSKYLKSIPLIGNLVIAFLIAFSILLTPILDVENYDINYNHDFVLTVIYIVSFFVFFLSFILEIVKDIKDINRDYLLKMNTLPILLGRDRMQKIAVIISLVPSFILMIIILYIYPENKITAIYLFVFVLFPLIYSIQKLLTNKSKKGFHKIDTYLKICMFFAIHIFIILSYFN